MKIPFATFKPMHDEIRKDLDQAYNKVIDSNYFIQGKECELFEKEFADYCNAKYCVGVATGLDALYLILRAMNIGNGDEVIVPSNTYIATALAVSYCGATPIFVEPELETYNINPALIEEKITDQTKAIIAVHLQGRPADMDAVNETVERGKSFCVKLSDVNGNAITGGQVSFKINGVSYIKQVNETGYAKLNINLNPGVYKIITAFSIRNYEDKLLYNTLKVTDTN